MLNLVRSLLLAGLFSTLVPVLFIAGLQGGLSLIGHVPGLDSLSAGLMHQFVGFLRVFGSGNPTQGVLIIGATCGLVGLLFDTYILFYHQYSRAIHDHPMQ